MRGSYPPTVIRLPLSAPVRIERNLYIFLLTSVVYLHPPPGIFRVIDILLKVPPRTCARFRTPLTPRNKSWGHPAMEQGEHWARYDCYILHVWLVSKCVMISSNHRQRYEIRLKLPNNQGKNIIISTGWHHLPHITTKADQIISDRLLSIFAQKSLGLASCRSALPLLPSEATKRT